MDHIPPKTIFPQPIPNGVELVTVPCCKRCNGRASQDDKYFAAILSSSLAAQKRPEGIAVWERLVRGATWYREEKGFWKGIQQNIEIRERRSPGGILLEALPAHTNYQPRFQRVLDRIVRGFFFKLRGRRVPDDFAVVVNESPKAAFWEENQDLKHALVANGCLQPMEGVFSLWSTAEQRRPDITAWYMIFLEAADFLCWTTPKVEWKGPLYFCG